MKLLEHHRSDIRLSFTDLSRRRRLPLVIAPRSVSVCWAVLSFSISAGHVAGQSIPPTIIDRLGAQEFQVREAAEGELLTWARTQPGEGIDLLFAASRAAADPEVRERCLSALRVVVSDQYSKEGKGYIGIGLKVAVARIPDEPGPRAVIHVTQLQPNSPGERAGLKAGDAIISLNGVTWQDETAHERFSREIAGMKPDTKVRLKILRDQKLFEVEVILARRPVAADNPFIDRRAEDLEQLERAAKEEHFKQWMKARRMQD